jgi:hypothetical protein
VSLSAAVTAAGEPAAVVQAVSAEQQQQLAAQRPPKLRSSNYSEPDKSLLVDLEGSNVTQTGN